MRLFGQHKFETILVGSIGVVATAIGAYAMLVRYFLPHIAAGWADELVVYLMMWAIWISASRLVAENSHVHADIIVSKLPRAWQHKIAFLNSLLGFVFCCVMTYAAWQVVMLAFELGEKSESVLQFPIAFYDMSLLAGMLLMAWRYLQLCRTGIRGDKADTAENSDGVIS